MKVIAILYCLILCSKTSHMQLSADKRSGDLFSGNIPTDLNPLLVLHSVVVSNDADIQSYIQLDQLRKWMCSITIQMCLLLFHFRFWNTNFNVLINTIK
jgi:hypothetical protein